MFAECVSYKTFKNFAHNRSAVIRQKALFFWDPFFFINQMFRKSNFTSLDSVFFSKLVFRFWNKRVWKNHKTTIKKGDLTKQLFSSVISQNNYNIYYMRFVRSRFDIHDLTKGVFCVWNTWRSEKRAFCRIMAGSIYMLSVTKLG